MSDQSLQPAAGGAWSSALSTNEYAACVASGLRPLGFVQGCSVVSWNFMSRGSNFGFGMGMARPTGGYYEQYNCPHGMVSAEHRMYGVNYEKTWVEDTWTTALRGAYERLVDEATRLGAHGIIGIRDRTHHWSESNALEISLSGTAVAFDGVERPETPFTTFLAGQKLSKLVEAGFAPVAIAVSLVSIGVYGSCITEMQMSGSNSMMWAPSGEIEQVTRAHDSARRLVRERVREQLGGDSLHGAHLTLGGFESSEGPQIEVTLKGNRVRRFRDFEALPPPRPIVRLLDR